MSGLVIILFLYGIGITIALIVANNTRDKYIRKYMDLEKRYQQLQKYYQNTAAVPPQAPAEAPLAAPVPAVTPVAVPKQKPVIKEKPDVPAQASVSTPPQAGNRDAGVRLSAGQMRQLIRSGRQELGNIR